MLHFEPESTPPHPQMVEGIVVQNNRRNVGRDYAVLNAQSRFLTDD